MTKKTQLKMTMPSYYHKMLELYIKANKVKRGEFLETVMREVLGFYESMSDEERHHYHFQSAPPSSSAMFRGYVGPELKERMDSLAKSDSHGARRMFADIYWTAFLRYIREHELFENDFERSLNVVAFSIYKEEHKLIRTSIATGTYETLSEFFEAAYDHWLEWRQERGSSPCFEYRSRPMGSAEDSPGAIVEVSTALEAERHKSLSDWAHTDYQSLRNVIYNAVVLYLDHQLEEMMVEMSSLTKTIQSRTAHRASPREEEEE